VVLKGRTIVAAPTVLRASARSPPALATAGSGDVLSGVVRALLARGLEPRAPPGQVYVHGIAGEGSLPGWATG
jgi:NAD(P)H-hydrate epimerase